MADKLHNTQKSSKASWSLLKRFLDNKKTPLTPPISHKNEFENDFQNKVELFSPFLTKQYYLIINNSKVPTSFTYMTEKRLGKVNFSIDKIGNIIQGLVPNKVHGQNKISICMLRICGNSICNPLEIIYKEGLSWGLFSLERKKGNIVSIHKKGDKQSLKSYRTVSLLPVWWKILERFMFNKMFQFFY